MSKKRLRPIGDVILINHDDSQNRSDGGIFLPDSAKIDVATAIIKAMPDDSESNTYDFPYTVGDRIVYDTRKRMPLNGDPRDRLFLIHKDAVLAVEEDE